MIHGVRFIFYAFMLWHSWASSADHEARFDTHVFFQR
jgi:hypothetical protein